MMRHILKCMSCGNYTLKGICSCGSGTAKVGPAKFSPQDAYAHYRRAAKRSGLERAGLA